MANQDYISKTVLITGGSSGIGKQIASDLLKRGDQVIIVSADHERLFKAEAELKKISSNVKAFKCDITLGDEVQATVQQIIAEFGHIDILINNAGYAVYRTFEESNLEEILNLVDVNFLGMVRVIKACLPSMKLRGKGQIVNISSIAGKLVLTPNATYCASKYAGVALSECLRYELEPFGIKISIVCPGRVETPFFDHETFQKRTVRRETRFTIPIEKVSRLTIQAIDKGSFMTFLPKYYGVIAWIMNCLPWIIRPIYGALMRSRIRTLMQQPSLSQSSVSAMSDTTPFDAILTDVVISDPTAVGHSHTAPTNDPARILKGPYNDEAVR